MTLDTLTLTPEEKESCQRLLDVATNNLNLNTNVKTSFISDTPATTKINDFASKMFSSTWKALEDTTSAIYRSVSSTQVESASRTSSPDKLNNSDSNRGTGPIDIPKKNLSSLEHARSSPSIKAAFLDSIKQSQMAAKKMFNNLRRPATPNTEEDAEAASKSESWSVLPTNQDYGYDVTNPGNVDDMDYELQLALALSLSESDRKVKDDSDDEIPLAIKPKKTTAENLVAEIK